MKRFCDLVFLSLFSLIWVPLFIAIAILVRWKIGAPIFFLQKRPGLRARLFEMIKFRTMGDTVDAQGLALPDHLRLSPFGLWLRSTSLDELPELFNVIKGEMSLVGPRPLLVQYLGRYSPIQARRHEVRPGLTGWAQIHGGNTLDWEERFALDVWYVEHHTGWLDVKILLTTLWQMFFRKGRVSSDETAFQEFQGNPPGHSSSAPP